MGVLVANHVLESFSVNILSNDFEDILCISHTATAETFGVCTAYLPPSNSSRGDKSLEFVKVMRMLVHKLHLLDNFVICGDFNARCSDRPDIQMLLIVVTLPYLLGYPLIILLSTVMVVQSFSCQQSW